MKVFLTGATGFIGGYMVDLLLKEGHTLHALTRDPAKAQSLAEKGVLLFKGDILDKECMREGMQGCDVVLHLAGWYELGQPRERKQMEAINVDGTRNTFELAHELGVKKIIHISTVAASGGTKGEVCDESNLLPETEPRTSNYDRTKWRAHKIALEQIEQGAPVIILVPGVIFGVGDHSLFAEMLDFYLKGWMKMIPSPETGITYVHVKDVVNAILAAMEKGRPGETYITTGPMVSGERLILEWAAVLGRTPPKIKIPSWLLRPSWPLVMAVEYLIKLPQFFSGETIKLMGVTYYAESDKAKNELGWEPRPIRERLEETFKEMGVL